MKSLAKDFFANAWRSWNRFWFESNRPESMALFRALFGSLLFVYILTRTPDVPYFYSEGGTLPLAQMRELLDMGARQSVFFWLSSDAALWVGHALLLMSLASLAVGFYPRVSALVAYVLHVSFVHRNMTAAYGIDSISVFFLLNLILVSARTNSFWGSIAFRLCQLQVCVIYFYSGLEKLKGTHWWYGDAIWRVLANHQLAVADFSWLAPFPLLIVLSTWGTLLWEVYFPVLVWLPAWRRWMLLAGVGLHVGISLTMNIPFFGFLMMFAYAVFLTDREIGRAHV